MNQGSADGAFAHGRTVTSLHRRGFLKLAGTTLGAMALPACATPSGRDRGDAPPIGMNMLLWTDRVGPEHFPIFARLKEAGFDGAEIPIGGGTKQDYVAIRKALDNAGLRCTAVTSLPAEANPIDADPAVRANALTRLRETIDHCATLRAEVLCGPFHSAFKTFAGRGPTAAEMDRSAEVMAAAADHAKPQELVLAAEFLNRFECYLVNTAADTLRLCRLANRANFGMTYDTHHAHIEVKNPNEAIAACAPFIRHIHVSENDRGTPGSGQVRFAETFEALRRIDYRGWLTIESFSRNSPEFAAAIHVWRDFFASPDDVWRDGITFIRDQWAHRR
jgi:D-psicose/D-tagatose/L-ribulose 3-epimerase